MRTFQGRFIVFEGLDGSGTTTQAAALAVALRAEGYDVCSTREPSDGPVGMLIRQALRGQASFPKETLALLYAADRVDHLRSVVFPALRAGHVVISERYVLSTLAYQGAEMAGHGPWLQVLNDFAPAPDATIFLQVSPAAAAQRRAARGLPLELFEDEAVQQRVALEYERAMARAEEGQRILRVNGERSEDAVAADVLRLLREALAHG